MKLLNYSQDYLLKEQCSTYKELFDLIPNLYLELSEEEAIECRIPYGKYKNMLIVDLFEYDYGYSIYMRNLLLNEKISSNLHTYYQRIKLLQAINFAERQYKIESRGKYYERARKIS